MSQLLLEMATFAKGLTCEKERDKFDFELHGGDDRIYPPHIHIYKQKVRHDKWTIEINLAEYLSSGDVVFCRIVDNGRKWTSAEECLKYKGIYRFIEFVQKHLTEKPTERDYVNCRDNLAAAIQIFAEEADMNQLRTTDKKYFSEHYMGLYKNIKPEYKLIFVMLSMHKTINKKFHNYFDKSLIKTFPEAFSR